MPRIVEVFGEQRHDYIVEVGSTINEHMVARNPDIKNFPVPVVAGHKKEGVDKATTVDDVTVILRKDWDTPLKEDDMIVIIAVLCPKGGGGGGSNVMQIVLGVLLMIVGGILVYTGVGATLGWGMILSGALMLIGMVMGMMTQPKLPSGALGNEEASPTYSLNGAANQARLLQPIPEGFGKIQCVPDVVAQPYYVYEGNDQYLYQVFGIGRGTYLIESMWFGEEYFWKDGSIDANSPLIEDVSDVEVQIVLPGDPVTLFPDNVESNPNVKSIQLFPTNDEHYAGWKGPYVSSPPGTYGTKFQIDVIYPRGIGRYDDRGNLNNHTIRIAYKYQLIDDFDNALAAESTESIWTASGNTLTAQRKSQFVTLAPGRYRFQFVNKTEGNSDTARPWLDEVYIDGLRTYVPGTLRYTQSTIAVKIKATNVLSNNAQQQFRVVSTRILPVWNSTTKQWLTPAPTRRFDAAIAAMCKQEWGGNLPDARIDLEALAYCQKKIDEFGWNFDTFIDSAYSVFDLVAQSCLPFRVFPRIIADRISFLFDEENRPVKHVFTPRDVVRGSLTPSWATHTDATPDDVIVSYLDEAVFYARREVQCTLPQSESREPKYLQYPLGIVNRKTAHDYGIYVAACNRYRRLSLEFKVECLGRLFYLGDILSMQHPRLRSIGWGKVTDWNATDRKVYVDSMPTLDAAPVEGEVWMVFNDPQGRPWGPVKVDSFEECCVTLNEIDFELVRSQQGDFFGWLSAGYSGQPTTWALQKGKNIDRRYVVKSVQFEDLEHATLTVMNDDPRVFNQHVSVPPWEYRGMDSGGGASPSPYTPPEKELPQPLDPPASISVSYAPATSASLAQFFGTWAAVPGALIYEVQFGLNVEAMEVVMTSNISFRLYVENVPVNTTYIARVRAVNDMYTSEWKQTTVTTKAGA